MVAGVEMPRQPPKNKTRCNMTIEISIRQNGDHYEAVAESQGRSQILFPDITFLSHVAAGTWVNMNFWDKFGCRRVAGKWILEV